MRETIKSSLCCDYLYMKLLETVTLPGGMVSAADGAWTPLAWVTDRLGNVREVADMSTGTVVERNDYYAYGSRIEQDPDVINAYPQVDENRWRYAGKEEQEDVTGIPYDDFGARLYDPHLGTWMAPDPMAEKYPGISPYLYCSGDPVNVVDPQGDTLLFAPGVSERFKQQFAEAVEFMNAAGTSYNIAKIHASERVYYIKEGKKSTFQYDRMTIVWNPNRIVYNSYSGLLRSPATVLAHEFRHAEDYDMLVRKGKTQEEAKTILGAYNEQYDTEADRRAITETEQYVARAHGEIGSN